MRRFVGLVLLAAACTSSVEDTGTSIEITGYLDPDRITVTSLEPLSGDREVELTVVGQPGATNNSGEVQLANLRSGEVSWVGVTDQGGFVGHLQALEGDAVEVSRDGVSDTVQVDTHPVFDFPAIEGSVVTHPNDHHWVLVEIEFVEVQPDNRHFVLSNPHGDQITDMVRYAPRVVVGEIRASVGDILIVHALEGDKVSHAVELEVP